MDAYEVKKNKHSIGSFDSNLTTKVSTSVYFLTTNLSILSTNSTKRKLKKNEKSQKKRDLRIPLLHITVFMLFEYIVKVLKS